MHAYSPRLADRPIGLAHWFRLVLSHLNHVVLALASGGERTAAATVAGTLDPAVADAFRREMLPHLDAAYSLARYLTRDAVASDDIVQDSYLKALRGFPHFRGGDARAWILAITRNSVRDWQQRQAAERRRIAVPAFQVEADDAPGQEAIEAIASDVATAEGALVRQGEDRRIRGVVERLPERLKEVLVLRELEDLSYREIAEITQTPIGTVMSRLARAREAFAAIWQRLEASGSGR